jgi:hypothetical protein
VKVSSRVERQTRNLARGLFWVGILLLGVTISMTGKFGWDSGTTYPNKWLNAIGHGAVDIVGAMLITGSAVCIGWRYRVAGFIVFLGACVCIAISGIAVFGFLSSNRVGISQSAANAAKVDNDQLEWLRNQTVTKGGSASQRDTFLGEIKGQIRELKAADVTAPDTQSSELATMVGVTTAQMNRSLTAINAAAILFAQFAVLWLYGFLRHRIEPDAEDRANQNSGDGSGGTSGWNLAAVKAAPKFKAVQFSKEQAFAALMQKLAAGEQIPNAQTLCVEWNRPKNTVHIWLKEWGEAGYLTRKRSGNSKAIVAGPAHLNGSMGTA